MCQVKCYFVPYPYPDVFACLCPCMWSMLSMLGTECTSEARNSEHLCVVQSCMAAGDALSS